MLNGTFFPAKKWDRWFLHWTLCQVTTLSRLVQEPPLLYDLVIVTNQDPGKHWHYFIYFQEEDHALLGLEKLVLKQ